MKEDNKLSTISNSEPSGNIITNTQLTIIETLAKKVATSKALSKEFKDSEGKVSESDVFGAMILGNEMGISPMASVLLGKRLNAKSFFSVLRGRELGLGAIASISKIYNIDTKNGSIIALAVDVITAKILQTGTSINYIRDFEPTPTYTTLGGTYIGHKYLITNNNGEIKDDFFLYVKDITSVDETKKANQDGKIIIKQSGITNVSSVRLVRKSNNSDITINYSLQEAIDAELYMGYHSKLKDSKGNPIYVKGKGNWNNHPATHLRHRPLSIGGRIIAADALMGAYSIEEAIEIMNIDSVQTEKDLVEHQYETNKSTGTVEIIENTD